MSNTILQDDRRSGDQRSTAHSRWQSLLASLDRRPTVAGYTQAARELESAALVLRSARLALLSTFTLETVHPYLAVEAARAGFAAEIYQAPFNSIRQELLDARSGSHVHEPEIVFVAQMLEDVCPALQHDFLDLGEDEIGQLIEQTVAELFQALRAFREHSRAAIVVHNFNLPAGSLLGIHEPGNPQSQTAAIRRLNERLVAMASTLPGVFVLDFDRLCANAGYQRWRHDKMWFNGRAPLSPDMLPALAREMAGFVQAILGTPRKCVVVDLDNTLWGGVVGEDGIGGIALGHTWPGNAFREVQRGLLQLHRRGVLLAVCSKNNEADALEVFRSHPDMLLKREHFSAWRVNWEGKPQNLLEIAAELNIGSDSLVFLDDNPRECQWMRQALPEVLCVEACAADGEADPLVTLAWLRDTRVFDKLSFSADDRRRGDMYRQQQERRQLEQQVGSLDEFLRSLEMRVEILPVDDFSFPRVLDLLHKTNQFNLTTRRHGEVALRELADDASAGVFTLRVLDRFGDNGITGVAIVKHREGVVELDSFLLSCRVIGRRVETALLSHLVDWARSHQAEYLSGLFMPTAKNAPAASFFVDHGFMQLENRGDATQWLLSLDQIPFSWPACIRRLEDATDEPCADGQASDRSADRLLTTIAGVLGVSPDDLHDDTSPATIPAWDSLNHLNLILALESEFETRFSPGDALAMQSVAAIRHVLARSPEDAAADEIIFRDLLPAELPAFRKFIAHSYGPHYVLAVNEPYTHWQFAVPNEPDQPWRMRVAIARGEIAGCLGYIPVTVDAAGRSWRGAWLANWMVAPEHRQSGLGPLLAREVTREFEITLAAGANEEARHILGRMGYTDLGLLTRYVAVLDRAGAATLAESGLLDWPAGDEIDLAGGADLPASLPVTNLARADGSFTTLWHRLMGSRGNMAGTTRSADYLNWRYLDHPQFSYQLLAAHDESQLRGFAVYRVEQARDREVRVARLVELVAEPLAQRALLLRTLADARAAGAVAIDFFCGSRSYESLLLQHGFLSDGDIRTSQIPVLYQPLDRRRAGIRYLADLRNLPPATTIEEWYVTKSDGDQDRPN